MANIRLKGLYTQQQREFATQGAGVDNFALDFQDAVNRAIRRINRQADLETAIAEISGTEGEVELDTAYEDVLSALVTVNLLECGRPPRNRDFNYTLLKREIPELIDSIRTKLLNDEQASDPDAGVIGIGVET